MPNQVLRNVVDYNNVWIVDLLFIEINVMLLNSLVNGMLVNMVN